MIINDKAPLALKEVGNMAKGWVSKRAGRADRMRRGPVVTTG